MKEEPLVESIIATFPVAEFAEAMDMPEHRVRAILRSAILEGLATGGSIDNMRTVMESAIRAKQLREEST